MNLKQALMSQNPEIIRHRRALHQIPEVGLSLPKTAAYVCSALAKLQIPYECLVEGNAVVGVISGDHPGPTLALRADMDALPIREETGRSFASQNGAMHACGHDAHTAMLLGAAQYLKAHSSELFGSVKLLFQPGEEYPGGAKPMIDAGCLSNPKVDRVLGLHAGHIHDALPSGTLGFKIGQTMASMDRIALTLEGTGCHGAYPHMGQDLILTASELVVALQRIVAREINPTHPAVVSLCRIQGGQSQNILPNRVDLEGTVRSTHGADRTFLARRIEEIARYTAAAAGVQCHFTYDWKYPPLHNDEIVTKEVYASAKKIFSDDELVLLQDPIMGGEDMAFFLEKVPGTFVFLANPAPIDGVIWPHHHPKFDLAEDALWKGSALFCQAALDYLSAPLP
ncbi:N-acetyl-L,L-diaminopimelate deacetylase [Clostridiaceae bacterium JG1575]|nr:N-acetyl-L,L-diaminopimelate deacetylase [Clostridiaceae bacterium JG1575]